MHHKAVAIGWKLDKIKKRLDHLLMTKVVEEEIVINLILSKGHRLQSNMDEEEVEVDLEEEVVVEDNSEVAVDMVNLEVEEEEVVLEEEVEALEEEGEVEAGVEEEVEDQENLTVLMNKCHQ